MGGRRAAGSYLDGARWRPAAAGARAALADAPAVEAAAGRIEAELGPIDVWINGGLSTVFSERAEVTPEALARVTDDGARAVAAARERLRRRARGTVVQIGSPPPIAEFDAPVGDDRRGVKLSGGGCR